MKIEGYDTAHYLVLYILLPNSHKDINEVMNTVFTGETRSDMACRKWSKYTRVTQTTDRSPCKGGAGIAGCLTSCLRTEFGTSSDCSNTFYPSKLLKF
jgi:hypothetical protein